MLLSGYIVRKLTRRLSSVSRTATPASTLPTVRETSILALLDASLVELGRMNVWCWDGDVATQFCGFEGQLGY